MFWKDASHVMLVKCADFVIETCIQNNQKNCSWRLFVIYASTSDKKRKEQWGMLSQHIVVDRDRCLLMGYFNDTLDSGEKE